MTPTDPSTNSQHDAPADNDNNNNSSSKNHTSVLQNPLVLSILITETAERVAYYGFRAILVLYFTQDLQYSDSTAISLFAGTTALAYFSPLVGAVLADSAWGRFQTIWRFGSLYGFGLWLLTAASYKAQDAPTARLLLERSLTFIGLSLVCMGTGGIKPCVSAFGADQVVLMDSDVSTEQEARLKKSEALVALSTDDATPSSSQEERIREYFNSFYFCVNVGALGSFALIPIIRARWGFGAAFLFPTLFMMLALGVFRSQKNNYKHRIRDDSEPTLLEILKLCLRILKERFFQTGCGVTIGPVLGQQGQSRTPHHVQIPGQDDSNYISTDEVEVSPQHDPTSQQVYNDASQALHILPIMLFFPIFWMLYDQQGSVWTLQATRLNLHGLEPEQLQFLNPLEIMIFIPLFDRIIYPGLERRGFNLQPIRRMEYGMFLAAVSFFTSAWLEYRIQQQPPSSVSVTWQIPQITILTVGEIFLNVTGLEFAYSQAPANMQALVLALYLSMTTIGDLLGATLYASVFATMNTVVTMITCAFFMLLNLGLFTYVVGHWKPYYHGTIDGADETEGDFEMSHNRGNDQVEAECDEGFIIT